MRILCQTRPLPPSCLFFSLPSRCQDGLHVKRGSETNRVIEKLSNRLKRASITVRRELLLRFFFFLFLSFSSLFLFLVVSHLFLCRSVISFFLHACSSKCPDVSIHISADDETRKSVCVCAACKGSILVIGNTCPDLKLEGDYLYKQPGTGSQPTSMLIRVPDDQYTSQQLGHRFPALRPRMLHS